MTTAVTPLAYDRRLLTTVLVHHWPTQTSGCGCGWGVLGASHPEHVADVYEASLAAITTQELPQEGSVTDDAHRLGVPDGTQRHDAGAGGDSLKVAPDASEIGPAAEEGTSGRAARPASTSCSQCGQRTPVCVDCGDSIIFVPRSGFGNTGQWQHLAPQRFEIAGHMARPRVFTW